MTRAQLDSLIVAIDRIDADRDAIEQARERRGARLNGSHLEEKVVPTDSNSPTIPTQEVGPFFKIPKISEVAHGI